MLLSGVLTDVDAWVSGSVEAMGLSTESAKADRDENAIIITAITIVTSFLIIILLIYLNFNTLICEWNSL